MKDSLKKLFDEKLVTPDEAVQCIRSGQTVYIGTCTSTCYELARALGRRSDELENITIGCSNLFKPLDIMTDPDRFRIISYFMGPTERQAQKAGSLDYTSIHLSLVDIFCREGYDIFPSKGEMRKMAKGNGVSLNKEKLTAFDQPVTSEDLIDGKYLLVQKGKKNYYLITVK